MEPERTYTINEAAALTGLHGNTIRKRVRQGLVEARVEIGKFGEEYRIPHSSLVTAGLIKEGADPPPQEAGPVFTPELVGDSDPTGAGSDAATNSTLPVDSGSSTENARPGPDPTAALADLFERHSQAMFRLGYMQGEVDRLKAIADTAESLRQKDSDRVTELQSLQDELRIAREQAEEATALREELHRAQAKIEEMDRMRRDLEALKASAARSEDLILSMAVAPRKPFWKFWDRS